MPAGTVYRKLVPPGGTTGPLTGRAEVTAQPAGLSVAVQLAGAWLALLPVVSTCALLISDLPWVVASGVTVMVKDSAPLIDTPVDVRHRSHCPF